MAIVIAIDRDGQRHDLDVPEGDTLMEHLRDIEDGAFAVCGGNCSCATCHIYVEAEWLDKLPQREAEETELLQGVLIARDNSRLSCQIQMNETLSGLIVTIAPEEQM
jgi:ferredoxin, 2Fe-2S